MGIFTYLTSFWGLVRSDPGNNQSNEVICHSFMGHLNFSAHLNKYVL